MAIGLVPSPGWTKRVGRPQWKVELPGNPQPPAPVLLGNFVFFAPGSRSVLRIDVRDGSIQTFDVDTNVAAANPWLAGTRGAVLFGYGKSYWRSRLDSEAPEAGASAQCSCGIACGAGNRWT